jgi:hypothetical protein
MALHWYGRTNAGGPWVSGTCMETLTHLKVLRIHRCSRAAEESGQVLTAAEKEERSRTFWVAFCTDKQTAAVLGRSMSLRPDDLDVELPSQFDDQDEVGIWKPHGFSGIISQDLSEPMPIQAISRLVACSQMHVLLSHIITTVYTVKRHRSYKEDADTGALQDLSSRLQQYYASLPAHFRWSFGQNNQLLPYSELHSSLG